MYIISHTFRNSSLDYEQTIRKLNLGLTVSCTYLYTSSEDSGESALKYQLVLSR